MLGVGSLIPRSTMRSCKVFLCQGKFAGLRSRCSRPALVIALCSWRAKGCRASFTRGSCACRWSLKLSLQMLKPSMEKELQQHHSWEPLSVSRSLHWQGGLKYGRSGSCGQFVYCLKEVLWEHDRLPLEICHRLQEAGDCMDLLGHQCEQECVGFDHQ